MVKYTPATLKKLEDRLKEFAYEVRYEKGNFRSGYCVLEAKKVVMVNKFSTLESRIQSLIEITQQLASTGRINDPGNKAEVIEAAEEQMEQSEPGSEPGSDEQVNSGEEA